MKKYFIYYSYTGNGDFVADTLKRSDLSIIKIEPKKHMKKINFFRILRYGGEAMFKKKMPIQSLDLILDKDDVVIIGSPIWNDRLSTPILTLLDKFEFDKKTTKFIFYAGGGEANHAEKQIAKMGFEQKAIVLKEPKKYMEEAAIALKDYL